MKKIMGKLEEFLELGGTKKDIILLVISGISLLVSLFAPDLLPFNVAWIAIILCGVPIILEAIIGLVTAFDIKADVLVSIALVASLCIGEDFAAGEVAFIMQLGSLLEDLTVARARAGIAKRMMITIKCNITFSMTLNFVAIALAVTGVLNPVIGVLVHNAGSVLVIISSALLLKWKSKKI